METGRGSTPEKMRNVSPSAPQTIKRGAGWVSLGKRSSDDGVGLLSPKACSMVSTSHVSEGWELQRRSPHSSRRAWVCVEVGNSSSTWISKTCKALEVGPGVWSCGCNWRGRWLSFFKSWWDGHLQPGLTEASGAETVLCKAMLYAILFKTVLKNWFSCQHSVDMLIFQGIWRTVFFFLSNAGLKL